MYQTLSVTIISGQCDDRPVHTLYLYLGLGVLSNCRPLAKPYMKLHPGLCRVT